MREADIRAIQKRKLKVTTDSKHNLPVAENILNRNTGVGSPNMNVKLFPSLFANQQYVISPEYEVEGQCR